MIAAGRPLAIADWCQAYGTRLLAQPPMSAKIACDTLIERITSIAVTLPSPALYNDPDAQPPVSTMPTPKMKPAITEWMP